GLRELKLLRRGRPWLELVAEPDTGGRRPGFTLAQHSAHDIARAGHPHEVPEPQHHHLYVDMGQPRLGSRACGPGVRPEYMLRRDARPLTLRFRPLWPTRPHCRIGAPGTERHTTRRRGQRWERFNRPKRYPTLPSTDLGGGHV